MTLRKDGMAPTIAPAYGRTRQIARIWQGRTELARSEEYTTYLFEAGVRKIAATPDNRGVQMMRLIGDGFAEFEVLSYWDSRDAIRAFAGDDIEQVRHLPRDLEYMIGAKPTVRHFEVMVDHRPTR